MHWKDITILGWISLSAVAFNFQMMDMAASALIKRWGAPTHCKVCRRQIEGVEK